MLAQDEGNILGLDAGCTDAEVAKFIELAERVFITNIFGMPTQAVIDIVCS